ncbi:GNAT family N-acetyltransferase [Halococcus sp. AFM35]|uniref:GNAT family N-acetyltransferase n=1 Tax=Halococcus sp. AFM35 TaxID=3421653 RepID=UPI003EBFBABE
MPGPVFLDGEHISLRTPEEEDVGFLQRNINDPRVRRPIGTVAPMSASDEEEWIDGANDEGVSLLICIGGDPVGTIGLSGINELWGRAEVGYWLTPAAWGEGYATAATELLVEYGFDQRRLNKVVAHAFAFNAGSRRVLEKVGFTEEGVHRAEAFVNGEFVDVHRYGLLVNEWREGDE